MIITVFVFFLLVGISSAQSPPAEAKKDWQPGEEPDNPLYLKQSPGGVAEGYQPSDFGLGPNHIDKLEPYPPGGKGVRTPFDLWKYAGKAGSSFTIPTLPMSWQEWVAFHRKQKPELMKDVGRIHEIPVRFQRQGNPGGSDVRRTQTNHGRADSQIARSHRKL